MTVDFTEYETVMDLRAEPSEENYIAITLCDRSKFSLKNNNIISCFLEILNKTHSCLPLISSPLFVRIEYDLKIIGYKFCSTEIMGNLSQIEGILAKCVETFDPECNVELFEAELKSTQFKVKLNRTILNIIPKVLVKPEYSESLKNDLNGLIYNCGGIIGLWFGLSVVSITYGTVIFFFTKLPKHIKTSFKFLKHHLRRVFDFVLNYFTTVIYLFIRMFSSISNRKREKIYGVFLLCHSIIFMNFNDMFLFDFVSKKSRAFNFLKPKVENIFH